MSGEEKIFSASGHLSTGDLLNYIRRNMTRGRMHEVERHMADCDLCSDALDGLKKLDAGSSMNAIAEDLHRLAAKRKVVRQGIFSKLDLITIFAVIFLILFLIFVAVILFMNKHRGTI